MTASSTLSLFCVDESDNSSQIETTNNTKLKKRNYTSTNNNNNNNNGSCIDSPDTVATQSIVSYNSFASSIFCAYDQTYNNDQYQTQTGTHNDSISNNPNEGTVTTLPDLEIAPEKRTQPQPLVWWQKSAIRRVVPFLEQDLKAVMSESTFLKKHSDMISLNNRNFLNRHETNNNNNNHLTATIPYFSRSEIIIGSLLGQGGFSNVYEVVGFQLDDHVSEHLTFEQQQLRLQTAENAMNKRTGRGNYAIKVLQKQIVQQRRRIHLNRNNSHNNMSSKKTYATHEFEVAASDLMMEVTYLSLLQHPHIIAVRGLPYQGLYAFLDGQHDSYFLLCDRLHDTLDERICYEWNVRKTKRKSKGMQSSVTSFSGCSNQSDHTGVGHSKVPDIRQKTQYALQLAYTLRYLHTNNIIFRDLKPQNIGFTVSNTDQLVLFDFGLCREIPLQVPTTTNNAQSIFDENSNDDYGNRCLVDTYEMSGVGTRRYMAPEIINESKYNLKADVYSWSMVFWEILTHTRPYPYHSVDEHRIYVCQGNERPFIESFSDWPISIQNILIESWNEDLSSRYTIQQVCDILEYILIHDIPLHDSKHDDEKREQPYTPPSPRCIADDDIFDDADIERTTMDPSNMQNYQSYFCMNTILDKINCATDPQVKSSSTRLPLLLQTMEASNEVNSIPNFSMTDSPYFQSENDFSTIVYEERSSIEIQDDDYGMDHCSLFTWTDDEMDAVELSLSNK